MAATFIEEKICGQITVEPIGEGIFGKVYRTKDNKAIKVIEEKKTTLSHSSLVEMTILSQVRHPHLLYTEALLFDDTCKDRIGFLLPLMETNLKMYLDDHPELGWRERRQLFYQICSAVSALHSMKILHLDIKPENVLLAQNVDGGLHPYLTDFSISEYVNDVNAQTDLDNEKFSLPYRPHENFKRTYTEIYSGASCIWSLGQLAMFIFSGAPLFPLNLGEDDHEAIEKWFLKYSDTNILERSIDNWFVEAKYPIPPDEYKVLVNLLVKMLNLDPTTRLKINEVLDHPFSKGMKTILGSLVTLVPLVKRKEVPEIKYLLDLYTRAYAPMKLRDQRKQLTQVLYTAINLLYRVPFFNEPEIYAAVALQTALVFYNYIYSSSITLLEGFEVKDVKRVQIDLLRHSQGQVYHPSILDYLTDLGNRNLIMQLALTQKYVDLVNTQWSTIPDLAEMVKTQ